MNHYYLLIDLLVAHLQTDVRILGSQTLTGELHCKKFRMGDNQAFFFFFFCIFFFYCKEGFVLKKKKKVQEVIWVHLSLSIK